MQGGFYVEGINGVIRNERDRFGKRADDGTWESTAPHVWIVGAPTFLSLDPDEAVSGYSLHSASVASTDGAQQEDSDDDAKMRDSCSATDS